MISWSNWDRSSRYCSNVSFDGKSWAPQPILNDIDLKQNLFEIPLWSLNLNAATMCSLEVSMTITWIHGWVCFEPSSTFHLWLRASRYHRNGKIYVYIKSVLYIYLIKFKMFYFGLRTKSSSTKIQWRFLNSKSLTAFCRNSISQLSENGHFAYLSETRQVGPTKYVDWDSTQETSWHILYHVLMKLCVSNCDILNIFFASVKAQSFIFDR